MTNGYYGKYDLEAIKILDDFMPDRIFDAHMHLSHIPALGKELLDFGVYYDDMAQVFGNRVLRANGIAMPAVKIKTAAERATMLDFIDKELIKYPENVAEILVCPTDTEEGIEKQLINPRI